MAISNSGSVGRGKLLKSIVSEQKDVEHKIKRLESALQFYADITNHQSGEVIYDGGERARRTLYGE